MSITVAGVLFGYPEPVVGYPIQIKVTDADGRQVQKEFTFNNPDVPPGLEIIEATYGANGSTVNVASTLSSLIVNQALSMNVSNANLGGDLAFGSVKTLSVKYSTPSGLYLITVQEGSNLVIPSSSAQRLPQNSDEWRKSHLSSAYMSRLPVGDGWLWIPSSIVSDVPLKWWYVYDQDGDGLTLMQESAFGGDPFTPDAQTHGPSGSYDEGNFTYTFMCDAYRSDITYVVQSSADLVEWVDIAQSVAGAKTLAINGLSQVTDSGSGLREVIVKDTSSQTGNSRKFMRLKIIGPDLQG
jgi:hypothetical protein